MKKMVLTFVCSVILMGAIGTAALAEKDENTTVQDGYAYLCNCDSESMPKIFYVV